MTALLELDRVKKRFGGLKAVNDVSFAVERGEIVGLIGPNGAGKTTLFNLINGVFAPDAGRIVFDGTDIAGEKPYHIARYGLARASNRAAAHQHDGARELHGRRLFRPREPAAGARARSGA